VEKARGEIADLINADAKDIIFTSGSTESNNLSLQGLAQFYKSRKDHIITCQTEHKCILDTCRHLEEQGFKVDYVPVSESGVVDPDQIAELLTRRTLLVSTMLVNNEIGTVQPIKEIGQLCRDNRVFFHTDASQGLGKIPIDVEEMNIDLMSITAHKIYGPKGVGGLYINRKSRPRIRLKPIIQGGGQERGLRSGTLAPAQCVGFGTACRIAQEEMEHDHRHVERLFHRLKDGIAARIPESVLNGDFEHPFIYNLNVSFAFVEGESLMMKIPQISVSSGSACTSETLEPSYVLRAIGVNDDLAHTSIRFGIGRFTTEEEIDYTLDVLAKAVQELRDLSPLYEMH
jgi:cysteine desulfurase